MVTCSMIREEIPGFLAKLEEGYDVVSGWRSQRGDNFLLRRIPSGAANWLMAKLSGVDIHDFGTTFKAYRREVIQNIPLYGEMHRFIPALASWYGASICEIPISNPKREFGKSHYGISRTVRVFFDLLTIRFLLKYMTRPLHFFGSIGALGVAGGSALSVWLLLLKIFTAQHVMNVHGPILRGGGSADPGWNPDDGDRTSGRVAGAALPHGVAPGTLRGGQNPAAAVFGREPAAVRLRRRLRLRPR